LSKRRANYDSVVEQIKAYQKQNTRTETEWPELFHEECRKISERVPYSPDSLATSCLCSLEFDLDDWHAKTQRQEQALMQKLGVLPRVPTLIAIHEGTHDSYQPARARLCVEWCQGQ